MESTPFNSSHKFHIPVMGTGFSVDTPLKVAKYGISSVVSIMDDELAEQMREVHSRKHDLEFVAISERSEDKRARRITAYLNLINDLVAKQVLELQNSSFEAGSEITRYFEMLPDSALKDSYHEMLGLPTQEQKLEMQETLRAQAIPGSIDVNIMTKLDRDAYGKNNVKLAPEFADAMAALRGFANSALRSSIIFSAGINRRLYAYLTTFEDFFPDDSGEMRKLITLKVSDYRSAIIQGKYLAKRGLWVSEYRIESGLNCGGHAFATDGHLLGPIMEEFVQKNSEMAETLNKTYSAALESLDRAPIERPHKYRVTVQGGIGTFEEQQLLFERYGIDRVGWATPFLLVPEVTNVDEAHLAKLCAATAEDVHLTDHSPLGVPFWSLENSASEKTRLARIERDKPGSPCPKGFLVSNTEFTTVPICRASRVYQKRKIREIDAGGHSCEEAAALREKTLRKSCLCLDLTGGAIIKHNIKSKAQSAVCCGPNIVNFSKIVTLEEMIDHIYGRLSLITNPDRPHMFIRELSLYVEYFRTEVQTASDEFTDRMTKRFLEFKHNLIVGIDHYRELAERFNQEQRERFDAALDSLYEEIDSIYAGIEIAMSEARLATSLAD
ncbi:MAG: hypothetical protein IIB00_08880 [candidate division Zixibacteria bacterium]|nr:hypothetical protein [candidate division Zixibacteria bacterium]